LRAAAPEGNRYTGEDGDAQAHRQPQGPQGETRDRQFDHGKNHRIRLHLHVPAIGAALDLGKTKSPIGSRCSRATNIPSSG
jgi:hypothetical protein